MHSIIIIIPEKHTELPLSNVSKIKIINDVGLCQLLTDAQMLDVIEGFQAQAVFEVTYHKFLLLI